MISFLVFFLQLLCCIALPTLLIQGFKKELGYQGAFVASFLLILLPALAFLNNYVLTDYLNEILYGWGVEELKPFVISTWALTAGACAADVFSGLLLLTAKSKEDKGVISFFMVMSFLLLIVCQVVLPIFYFGSFGHDLAQENYFWLSVYGFFTAGLLLMLWTSKALKEYFYFVAE